MFLVFSVFKEIEYYLEFLFDYNFTQAKCKYRVGFMIYRIFSICYIITILRFKML